MKSKKYIILIGSNILEEQAPYAIIGDLNSCELSSLLTILLKKDTEILIRPQED